MGTGFVNPRFGIITVPIRTIVLLLAVTSTASSISQAVYDVNADMTEVFIKLWPHLDEQVFFHDVQSAMFSKFTSWLQIWRSASTAGFPDESGQGRTDRFTTLSSLLRRIRRTSLLEGLTAEDLLIVARLEVIVQVVD